MQRIGICKLFINQLKLLSYKKATHHHNLKTFTAVTLPKTAGTSLCRRFLSLFKQHYPRKMCVAQKSRQHRNAIYRHIYIYKHNIYLGGGTWLFRHYLWYYIVIPPLYHRWTRISFCMQLVAFF